MTGGSRGKILVVEDEEKIAGLLMSRLEGAGYSVHTEAHGRTALSYAAEYPPDLVILDLKLPDMGGYEVCKELRHLSRHWVIPVLMLTGMTQPIDQLRGFAYGADAYLTKPFELSKVLEIIAELLGDRTGTSRLS